MFSALKSRFRRSPVRWLQVCLWFTFIVLIFLGWSLWVVRDALTTLEARQNDGLALIESAEQIDEKVIATVLYAVTTGAPSYVQRHHNLARERERLLAGFSKLVDDPDLQEAIRLMRGAARQTRAIERTALALLAAGQSTEAIESMSNADYHDARAVLGENRARVERAFRQTVQQKLQRIRDHLENSLIGTILGSVLLIGGWWGAVRWARRWTLEQDRIGAELRAEVRERRSAEERLARELKIKKVTGAVLRQIAADVSVRNCLNHLVLGIEALRPGMLGSILLADPRAGTLSTAAAPSLPQSYAAAIDGIAIGPEVGSCGAAAFSRRRVIVEDIEHAPSWAPFRDAARTAGLAACWSQPVLDATGRALGTFALYYREPRAPDDDDLAALELGGDLARLVLDRHWREEQLRQAQKMEAIGNLTGGIAHDFNNLLSIVIGNLDLLEDGVRSMPEDLELLQAARDAGLRGADLTARLLAFARRQPLQPGRLDLNAVIAGQVKLLGRILGADIQVDVHAADDLWPVEVDATQLEAALTNLVTNARDAMPQGGRLTIATRNDHLDEDYAASQPDVRPGDYVAVEVSDTGSGMSRDAQQRAFEPFFTTKEVGRGTGLGLSMVFGFIKQSGGHVRIYSEEGLGTTIRLYLPRIEASGTDRQVEGVSDLPRARAGEAVLAVEDDPDVRRLLVRQLRDLGYDILEAENGPAALKVLEAGGRRIDLLLTDIIMPGGLSGTDLAERAVTLYPGLRVLFTSGFPETAFGDRGKATGSMRLLAKPYRKRVLAEKVREALA